MTGNELFTQTMAILSEEENDNADFRGRCRTLINALMAETFGVNNGLRAAAGLEPLTEPPELGTMDEEIPYEWALVNGAYKYGLAEKYVYDENDFQKVGYFNSLWTIRVNECRRGARSVIRDGYEG